MLRLNTLTAATFAGLALAATGAQAADMPEYVEPAPLAVVSGGWYLRGDIGASHQVSDDLDSPYFDTIVAPAFVDLQESQWDASWFAGVGVGYKFNDWFRADITGEYRGKSDFHGHDMYSDDADADIEGVNDYNGNKSEWVILANGYIDLPTWGIMTPFIGAGIGAARIKISDFTDFNPVVPGTAEGFSDDTSTWNFAWALHAGLAFELSQNWTVEVAYRYLNMGEAGTNNLLDADGGDGTGFNPFNWDNIASHDIKIGARYTF